MQTFWVFNQSVSQDGTITQGLTWAVSIFYQAQSYDCWQDSVSHGLAGTSSSLFLALQTFFIGQLIAQLLLNQS